MNTSVVQQQIMALDPAIPGFQISAFSLELLETIRKEGIVSVTNHTGAGQSMDVDKNMIMIQEVWVDGTMIPTTMPRHMIADAPPTPGRTIMTDEDEAVMTDENNDIMIDEA